jgi:hypothetical protein
MGMDVTAAGGVVVNDDGDGAKARTIPTPMAAAALIPLRDPV